MPNLEYAQRAQRIAILRLVLYTMLEHRKSMFGTMALPRGDDDATVLLFMAVALGHAEGKPMGASKLAQYLHTPRTTVLRKLDRLMELGLVVKQGHNFLIVPTRAGTVAEERMARYVKEVKRFVTEVVAAGVDILPDPGTLAERTRLDRP
jgi:predicted transcriptional regulator